MQNIYDNVYYPQNLSGCLCNKLPHKQKKRINRFNKPCEINLKKTSQEGIFLKQ